jgi:hypothetical protein
LFFSQQKSHARKIAWLKSQSGIGPSLPSAALPASGSRGRPIGPLSHCGSPALLN